MKYLLVITLFAIPSISFAWKAPELESICLGERNGINITLGTESNYIIEFADNPLFNNPTTVDFVHAGSHSQYLPITGTIYARYASDHNAKTSVSVKDCTPPKEEKKKSGKRRKKHSIVRRPVAPVVLPLFDLPLFDYPVWNLKD